MGWLGSLFGSRPRAIDSARGASQPVDFIALDLETASVARHSICQIGLAAFHQGQEVYSREILVDPECAFDPSLTRIHGLRADHVRGQPTFRAIHGALADFVRGHVVVAHSRFDMETLEAACARHGLSRLAARWLDTVVVARVAWPDLPNHKLDTVAAAIGHEFVHHRAVEDARAAGRIMVRAMETTGHPLEAWLDGSLRPAEREARPSAKWANRQAIRKIGSGEGPLSGHCVVMTGDFTAPKAAFAIEIAAAGAAVATSVSKKVTIVVTGDRDPALHGAAPKSGKQVRAEELIAEGVPIELLTEAQLRARMA